MRIDRLVTLVVVTCLLMPAVGVGVGATMPETDTGTFEVEITGVSTPVAEGETLLVETTVTNTGDAEDSQQIHLKRNESIVASVKRPPVTLAAGESTDVELEWTPRYGEAGVAKIGVQSDDGSAVRTIEIAEGPAFPVAVEGTREPVTAGESVTVAVTVRNTNETTETTRVGLSASDEVQAETSVELEAGETRQVDLTWETTASDAGNRTVEVVSTDAVTEATVSVTEGDTGGLDSGASGGGSAGSPERETGGSPADPEQIYSVITGDHAYVSGHAVEYVEFANATEGLIIVEELVDRPAGIDEIDNLTALYRIEGSEQVTPTNATVEISMNADDLDGAALDSVVVHHWVDGAWTPLETKATPTVNSDVRVTAHTTSFSVFAVTTGNPPAGDAATETETETDTLGGTTTETAADPAPTAESTTDGSVTTEAVAESDGVQSADGSGFGLAVALVALLSVVTLGGHLARRS